MNNPAEAGDNFYSLLGGITAEEGSGTEREGPEALIIRRQ